MGRSLESFHNLMDLDSVSIREKCGTLEARCVQ